jgi:hypothetical protein
MKVARELLSFEIHVGLALAELQTWPDNEVSSLFLARLLFLWRARFPNAPAVNRVLIAAVP